MTNLRTALREGLHQRNFGEPVRVEVSSGCTDALAQRLLREFGLPDACLYRVGGPVTLVRFMQLPDAIARPDLKFAPFSPAWPKDLPLDLASNQLGKGGMFERLRQGDVMLHQPFESFDAVLALLREAVNDPQVLAIKQTIYRTGAESPLMDLLIEGARRGKEVMVVVEDRKSVV